MHVVNGQNYALERDAPEAKAIGEIVVSEQNGEVFTGRYRYTHISENSADGSAEQKPMSEETIAGVLDFDGTYIVVEQPDSGIHRFRVIDENTLEVILYRSGPGAVVMRGIFKRRQ